MDKHSTTQPYKLYISLPSQAKPIAIGPGTVTASGSSISTVSIAELRKSAQEVSKLGIYDTDKKEQYPY